MRRFPGSPLEYIACVTAVVWLGLIVWKLF